MKKKFLSGTLFLLGVIFSFKANVFAQELYGSISVISEGTSKVDNNNTANVTVKYTAGNLKWYEKDTKIGRNSDGYWIGIKIEAPKGRSENASFQRGGKTVKFNDVKDGEDYVNAWLGVNQERLKEVKEKGEPYTILVYDFDWDADGDFDDQTLVVQVDPDKIVLEDVPETHAIVTVKGITGNRTFTVEKGKSLNEYLSDEEKEKLNKLLTAPEGKKLVGIFKDDVEFSLDEKITENTTLTIKFEDIKAEEPIEESIEEPKDDTPKTGVNDSMFFVISMTLLSGASVIVLRKKVQ